MNKFIELNSDNIENEHICCAFSDKKCVESYKAKKDWLSNEFKKGYVFRRLDERAKVFIEYGPSETAWVPVSAPNYLNINCFWVSGKYKKNGYGKQLLQSAISDAEKQERDGLVTVVGVKKFNFMSDTKWLLKQGFQEYDRTSDGFALLAYKLNESAEDPKFNNSAKVGELSDNKGIVVYYSNRCPFSEYHVHKSLKETADKRNIPLKIIKLNSIEEAQNSPSPATIFSLYLDGRFITTDISICLDSRFDKIINKLKN